MSSSRLSHENAPEPSDTKHHDDGSDSSSASSENEFDFIESTWEHGVETGLTIQWPGTHRPLHLSTKLTEDAIAPLFNGTQWAGTRVWKAAIVALEYLLQEHNPVSSSSRGATLLELGCGLGVPSMLWHLLHERRHDDDDDDDTSELHAPVPRVVLTDMPDLLPQLVANVQENFSDYHGKSIQARALDWSVEGLRDLWKQEEAERLEHSNNDDDRRKQRPLFDICLNCDCIYEPLYGRAALEALADVLAEVARLSPSTLLVTSVERRNGDCLEDFLKRLEATGTVQCPIQLVLRNDDDPHHVIEIYVTKGQTVEEGTPIMKS